MQAEITDLDRGKLSELRNRFGRLYEIDFDGAIWTAVAIWMQEDTDILRADDARVLRAQILEHHPDLRAGTGSQC